MSSALLPCLVAFACALVFALVLSGWRQRIEAALIAPEAPPLPEDRPLVSLIVPARQAEATLTALLQDLNAQTWPRERTEVLVVDDGSTDGTRALVERMARHWPGLRCLTNQGIGKKAAITTGAEAAQGTWLVLTDADARCGPARVERILAHALAEASEMVIAPVRTIAERGPLGLVQAAEAAALQGATAATALGGGPVLANGANLAFTREAFFLSGGYVGDRWASGDDVFLLQRFRRQGRRVSYLMDRTALVTVEAEPTFAGFWQQRLRWAGKMRGVGGAGTALSACGVALPWLLVLLTAVFDAEAAASQGLFGGALLLLSAWALWMGSVLALVRTMDGFLERCSNLISNAFALLAFSVYAPLITLLALVVRPTWKGRRIER